MPHRRSAVSQSVLLWPRPLPAGPMVLSLPSPPIQYITIYSIKSPSSYECAGFNGLCVFIIVFYLALGVLTMVVEKSISDYILE